MRGTLPSILALAIAATLAAQTPGPAPQPKQVHGQGCVQAGVEAGCLVVKDTGTGRLYNLIVKGDRPAAGIGISFTGVPFHGMTACMQGAPLTVTHWERNDSLQCSTSEAPPQ